LTFLNRYWRRFGFCASKERKEIKQKENKKKEKWILENFEKKILQRKNVCMCVYIDA